MRLVIVGATGNVGSSLVRSLNGACKSLSSMGSPHSAQTAMRGTYQLAAAAASCPRFAAWV